jgi:spore maturation protein CgeB
MKITIYGLTITSSWGNGHATTFRSLCRALHRRGHHIDFVEKNVEWYASNRDMPSPTFCTVHLYEDWSIERSSLLHLSADADVIVIGSFFPDAISLTRQLLDRGSQRIFFYDIDTPITMAQLRDRGATDYLDPSLMPEFAAYLSFTGGPTLRTHESTFGVKRARAFYCSVDPEIYLPVQPKQQFCADLSYLGTYAPDRQASLLNFLDEPARLQPDMQFLIAGPQYPASTTWAPNVRRIIHIAPPEHPAFYSSARFTLNLTRAEMIAAGWSPSVRLFEASACGAAILSDPWPGIGNFFTPGEEILLPASATDVVRLLRDFGDADRTKMGAKARDRILSEHTSDHRARQFEAIVSECSS